jgi:hypothetical protein
MRRFTPLGGMGRSPQSARLLLRTRRLASSLPPQTVPTIQASRGDSNQAKAKEASPWLTDGPVGEGQVLGRSR